MNVDLGTSTASWWQGIQGIVLVAWVAVCNVGVMFCLNIPSMNNWLGVMFCDADDGWLFQHSTDLRVSLILGTNTECKQKRSTSFRQVCHQLPFQHTVHQHTYMYTHPTTFSLNSFIICVEGPGMKITVGYRPKSAYIQYVPHTLIATGRTTVVTLNPFWECPERHS